MQISAQCTANTVSQLATGLSGIPFSAMLAARPWRPYRRRHREERLLCVIAHHVVRRSTDIDQSLGFYCNKLGMREVAASTTSRGRGGPLIFSPPTRTDGRARPEGALVELTYNWDPRRTIPAGRNFGHLAYEVDDIYATCQHLMDNGVTINRPPRDGRMAFVKSPDGISIELLQKGDALPQAEPWSSMENTGSW